MVFSLKRTVSRMVAVCLAGSTLMLGACGGGGSPGVSSQVVSGVASVGATLSGEVSLKDASATPQVKQAAIGNDGSFAIDVTDMQAPFILEAVGTATGTATSYTLHSFADGTGTANINPLSDAIVASAAGDDDASKSYRNANSEKLHKISRNLQATVTAFLLKLQPLLQRYNAQNSNPITSKYIANQIGLDGMFDNIKITVSGGLIKIYNRNNGVIYSGQLSDIANGVFNVGTLPPTTAVPAAPAGVTATGGAGQVTVSWTPVASATAYNVYFSTTAGVTTAATKLGATSSPKVLTGLAAGTAYYCVVTALNSAGESVASSQVSAATSAQTVAVPATPAGVMATGGTKQVTLSWSAVTGATSYNVYYATASGVTTTSGTKITGATSGMVQNGLAAGTAYYYIVTAANSAGESAASVQVAATTMATVPTTTVPVAPTGVSAAGGTQQATISWTAVTGASSYNIYWSTVSGVSKTTGTKIAGTSTPYVQANLTAGTTYYYIVTAVNSAGEGAASIQASATTAAAPVTLPATPTGVTATGGANQATISWTAVSGATSYNIYWSTTSGVTNAGSKIANATTPYLQTGLAAGTTYYYIVTAVNGAGEGSASAQVSAATTAAAPAFDALSYYTTSCLGCHGTLGRRTAAQITAAIGSIGSMSKYRTGGASALTAAQITAIAAASY